MTFSPPMPNFLTGGVVWDDEVDTIRVFDPYTQRSVENAGAVTIIPARNSCLTWEPYQVGTSHR